MLPKRHTYATGGRAPKPSSIRVIGYMPWAYQGNEGYAECEDGNVWTFGPRGLISNCGAIESFDPTLWRFVPKS